MMKDYYNLSIRALQLAGMSERTQQWYTRSVHMLVDFYNKTPDQVNEQELQDYFLHRKNVDKWSAATLRICFSGIKFFFVNVLKRDWHTLKLIYAKREQRLPAVLSLDGVWKILNTVNTPQNKAYLTTVYTCGLRLHEALFRASSDTMKKLINDPKHIGGDLPGFFGVLHTWDRQLQYHPHIHYIVPGGALSKEDLKWHPSRIDFYLPVKAMSVIFKVKFKDYMKKNNLFAQIPLQVWEQGFNVNCQAVGSSERSIK